MNVNAVIETYKDLVIQIATPYSTGTGFCLYQYNLIVTNEHVIRDNKQVVIEGSLIPKQMVKVLYLDSRYDLAFLECPGCNEMPPLELDPAIVAQQGDIVMAIGHPFGLSFTATQGIISNELHQENGVQYLQHDAALNPGNSGGPLINKAGNLIGVNTFVIRDGNNIGFSLPIHYLQQTINEFLEGKGDSAVRCSSCLNVVFEKKIEGRYCTFCGSKIMMISSLESYEPLGISKTLEDMLFSLGYQVELSRRGPNNWEIMKGSAKIAISYHEKSGLIISDATLCELPNDNIQELYTFLLKENYKNDSLTFCVRNQDIILSILIYDQYLNSDTATTLFQELFNAADHYDDLLVNKYNARWKKNS